MKDGIHPRYEKCAIVCACGNVIETRSTKEAIHVEIDGRQVMISTEFKKPVYETKDVRMLRAEMTYGFASRAFTLAHEVDREKAVAK